MEAVDAFNARIQRGEVPAGAHLVVERRAAALGLRVYTHHGIYVGNGVVAHYSGWATGMFRKGLICRVPLDEFAQGGRIDIRPYPNAASPEDVLQRVEEAEGRQPPYHLLRNNCEHFATYCASGEWKGSQATTLKRFGVVGHLVSQNLFARKEVTAP